MFHTTRTEDEILPTMIAFDKCGLSEATQNKLSSVFDGHAEIDKVVLYGSRAKGNFKMGSDIDLMLFAPKLDMSGLSKIETKIDDLMLPYKVDLALFHQVDNPDLVSHIQRVGIEFPINH